MEIPDNITVAFGLTAQGHMQEIRGWLKTGATWAWIGKEIGWHPATAREYYFVELKGLRQDLREGAYRGLCCYDKRHHLYQETFDPEDIDSKSLDSTCHCDNCFYGRTVDALKTLELIDELEEQDQLIERLT